jgi:GT2 family glycosyltransferase
MRTKDKVYIGWIDGGQVEGQFAADLATITLGRTSRIDGLLRVGGHLLSRQRNELVSHFLDATSAPWLLMIDSDHRIPVGSFDRLIDAAHEISAPVIAGLCFAAYPPRPRDLYPTPVPAIYRHATNGQFLPFNDYPHDQLVKIDAAGTGCLLMHRSALEKVRQMRPEGMSPKWCFFIDGPVGDDWYSEDLSFMRRLEAAEVPIHAHTGAIMPHLKTYTLTDAHHAQHMKELADERAGTDRRSA